MKRGRKVPGRAAAPATIREKAAESSAHRLAEYQDARTAARVPLDAALLVQGSFSMQSGAE